MPRMILLSMVLLAFTSMSTHALAKNLQASDESDASVQRCLKQNDINFCKVAGSSFWRGNPELAQKIFRHGCDFDDSESCSQLYFLSISSPNKKQSDLADYLLKKCAKNAKFCNMVAQMYEDQKDHKKALFFAKKFYLSEHSGVYPYWEYLYGNKTEAFKVSLQACESREDCIFYVRYMPDHPQLQRLLELSEKSCFDGLRNQASGATDCAILGSYFYKKQNISRAQSLWAADCQASNPSACLLLLASHPSPELTAEAFESFCQPRDAWEIHEKTLHDDYCSDENKKSSRLPAAINDYAQQTLQSYLTEQK